MWITWGQRTSAQVHECWTHYWSSCTSRGMLQQQNKSFAAYCLNNWEVHSNHLLIIKMNISLIYCCHSKCLCEPVSVTTWEYWNVLKYYFLCKRVLKKYVVYFMASNYSMACHKACENPSGPLGQPLWKFSQPSHPVSHGNYFCSKLWSKFISRQL